MKNIFLVTGEIGAGKTSLISSLISEIKTLGIEVKGIYSPPRIEKGEKTGIFAIDIASGNKKLLAFYKPGWDPDNPNREWKMDTEILDWGDDIIRNSIPTNVLIIDELGYLEFEKNSGWISAFSILAGVDYKSAIVVVRPSLLNQALARWNTARVITLEDPRLISDHTALLISQILAI